jgi:hypothetical protein
MFRAALLSSLEHSGPGMEEVRGMHLSIRWSLQADPPRQQCQDPCHAMATIVDIAMRSWDARLSCVEKGSLQLFFNYLSFIRGRVCEPAWIFFRNSATLRGSVDGQAFSGTDCYMCVGLGLVDLDLEAASSM